MAANNDTSLPERNRKWYQDDLTEVNEPMRKLLESYAKVPSDEVVKHVNRIRELGFATNPYPCIGLYRFLNLILRTHPLYATFVNRLQSPDATYLDLGCCFGQDLRQLVQDGIPSQRLIGLDIEGSLIERGYDFFLDRESLQSRFIVANISSAKNMAKLVRKGGFIVGKQMGSVKLGDVAAIKEGSSSYRNDVGTFDAMWKQVGEETQTRWKIEGTLDMIGVNPESPVEDANSRRLLFTLTRLE
ncbi:MAG: hypothetical protein Q9209_000345 [Squamulea sp. 1 TL-2023]